MNGMLYRESPYKEWHIIRHSQGFLTVYIMHYSQITGFFIRDERTKLQHLGRFHIQY